MTLIKREDAIEAVASRDETDGTVKVFTGRQVNEILFSLPSVQTDGDHISRADAIKTIHRYKHRLEGRGQTYGFLLEEFEHRIPSADATKKKAELKENGDWDCPDVGCYECDHHRSVEWCSLAIPNHEEIDETYKMVNEAFFKGFGAAEKQYRLLIETVEELDKKLAEADWIPCSERLPKENEYVGNVCKYYLIQDEYGDMHVAHLSSRGWETIESIKALGCDVIAWKPLPEPYREDGE